MRILLTGCHSLLGQKLHELLDPDFCELHGADVHGEPYFPGLQRYRYHSFAPEERAEVLELVRAVKPDWIINTYGVDSPALCEAHREDCWKRNVETVEHLVAAARRQGAKLIQVSSDMVFGGDAGPYTELDRPAPTTYFGRSKHAAENAVLGGNIGSTIVRTVGVIGHGRHLKPGFIQWLVGELRGKRQVKVVTDQLANVTLVDDLARALRRIITLGRLGVYHVAGRQIISTFDFAMMIAHVYDLEPRLLVPTLTRLLEESDRVFRPRQGGLVVDKAQRELNLAFSDVEEALKQFREQEAQLN